MSRLAAPKPHRRPKRKPRSQTPTLDPELTALASMLAEHEFDEGVKGWLVPRWRDGWNAVGFALAISPGGFDYAWLYSAWQTRVIDPEYYWIASEALVRVVNYPTLTAAYRCFQVRTAHQSAGDGSIYNTILGRAQLPADGDTDWAMLEHRCRDAIGTTAVMQNDGHDQLRQAFAIAWKRRLYSAAYALRPTV